MYLVRTTTVPRDPGQWPSMSDHGTAAPTIGTRDRCSAHRKPRPRNAGARVSSKSRLVAERDDSLALQTVVTVAVRLTACRIQRPAQSMMKSLAPVAVRERWASALSATW
jgi:hypothetical protein